MCLPPTRVPALATAVRPQIQICKQFATVACVFASNRRSVGFAGILGPGRLWSPERGFMEIPGARWLEARPGALKRWLPAFRRTPGRLRIDSGPLTVTAVSGRKIRFRRRCETGVIPTSRTLPTRGRSSATTAGEWRRVRGRTRRARLTGTQESVLLGSRRFRPEMQTPTGRSHLEGRKDPSRGKKVNRLD